MTLFEVQAIDDDLRIVSAQTPLPAEIDDEAIILQG